MGAIALTTPESRTRKRFVASLKKLAEFAMIEINLKGYGDGYTPSKLEPRDLPSDQQIIEAWASIPNQSWKNAFAVIATYGLRPHELWHLDFSEFPDLLVLEDTKTGSRLTKALPPEWVELFSIKPGLDLPLLTSRANRELGERTARQFKRYGIPFPPYNLRHAFCVRVSIEYQVPVAVAARLAGHSSSIHESTYLRHIRDDQVNSVIQDAIASQKSRV
jgi:integrase